MASDPNNQLAAFIRNIPATPAQPFAAEYIPEPIATKPETGCNLPAPILSTLSLPDLPSIPEGLDCNTNFIPTPIVVIPYVPSYEGPCPSFSFDAQYIPSTGECLNASNSSSFTTFTLSGGTGFNTDKLGINSTTDAILPDLHLYIPQVSSGESGGLAQYDIIAGQYYQVIDNDYDPTAAIKKSVSYVDKNGIPHTYTHGQIFKGITDHGTAAITNASDNALITIKQVHQARVIDYDRINKTSITTALLPIAQSTYCDFEVRRISIGADPDKLTGGSFDFVNETCGGKLIGEININLDDLDIPCANGLIFDAGYAAKSGQTIQVSGSTITATGVDLLDIIPHGDSSVLPGKNVPTPTLWVKSGNEWLSAKTSIDINNDIITQVGTTIPAGTYSQWYLQRISVSSGDTTGSQIEYIPSGNCGGTLVGDISINAVIPCSTQLNDQSLVSVGSHPSFSVKSYLNATGAETTISPALTLTKNTCSYTLGFNAANELIIPQIVINQGGNAATRTLSGNTLTYNLADSSPSNVSCVNCCRWS